MVVEEKALVLVAMAEALVLVVVTGVQSLWLQGNIHNVKFVEKLGR